MQLKDKAKIATNNPTLNYLIVELAEECRNAIAFLNFSQFLRYTCF
ncbi:MAG: hypothetical protein AB4290_05810 [Spirulina sp.]